MASPTSPPSGTAVTIAATLDYKGTPIPIQVSDLKNFVFQLTTPVNLGDLAQFVGWLGSELHLPVTEQEVIDLKQYIPIPALANLYQAFVTAPIDITTLNINYKQKYYAFGATMNFVEQGGSPSLTLFDGLSLTSIGVLVTHQESTTSP